ncbi:DUF3237 domain-containing protein [Nocardioides terrigena]|uniref:DUF3237 domain-containing protein n=1 Tax=Nocardioides terrigena TaxID=424797 RepID=UPI00131ED8EB|nr:DUF3237 domain-containing protein [Nocardioides terrigena]
MQLQPFGTFTAPLERVEFVGTTPRGRRLVGPIVNARLQGEHVRASQRGRSAADWLITGPGGATVIDVRISLRCDDGAFLQVSYSGRTDWAGGVGSGAVYSAFRFETGDDRYRWLHSRLVVGKGQVHEDHGVYDLFLLT